MKESPAAVVVVGKGSVKVGREVDAVDSACENSDTWVQEETSLKSQLLQLLMLYQIQGKMS